MHARARIMNTTHALRARAGARERESARRREIPRASEEQSNGKQPSSWKQRTRGQPARARANTANTTLAGADTRPVTAIKDTPSARGNQATEDRAKSSAPIRADLDEYNHARGRLWRERKRANRNEAGSREQRVPSAHMHARRGGRICRPI